MRSVAILLVALAALGLPLAHAQDLEPRRWSHLPTGLNVIGAGYGVTDGDLFLDPVLLLEQATVESQLYAASFVRTFGLFGKSARIDVQVPYQQTRWRGLLDGVMASASRNGFADPRLRLSVNLMGAPALAGREYMKFRSEHQVNTVLGAALAVRLPLGQYRQSTLLNLGSNRFEIRPQLGVVHQRGPWSYELTGSLFLYTDNDEFWMGTHLEQDPLYALQAHVVRILARGWWLSAGAAYAWGGEASVDGGPEAAKADILSGLSFGFPVARNQGMSLAYIRRRTDNGLGVDTDSLVLGWSMRF